jgi:hypothetical protein
MTKLVRLSPTLGRRKVVGLFFEIAHRYNGGSEVPTGRCGERCTSTCAISERGGSGLSHVTLFLHNVERLADLAELHFIISFWSIKVDNEHLLASWVMSQLERTWMSGRRVRSRFL